MRESGNHPFATILRATATLSVLLLLAAGCAPGGETASGGDEEPAPAGEGDGEEGAGPTAAAITVGVEAGSPYEAFYGERLADFTAETGIEVELQAIPHENMHQQFLSDAIAGGGSFDVYTADQPWIPEFAARGFLLPLDDRIDEDDLTDFVPSALDTVSYDGQIYALPYIVHNLALYYRTDLFEEAGLDGPPETWEEYREYASILTNPDEGVWGTLISGRQDGEVAIHLQSFIEQAGGSIIGEDGSPAVDSEAGLAAMELMTGIQFEDESSPPGLHDITDMQGLFLEGQLAMARNWPYMYSLAEDESQSQVAGQFDVAPLPGNPHQVASVFSWGYAIPAGSPNPDAAWEWVKWSTSSEMLEELGRAQVNPVPRFSSLESIMDDPALDERDRHAIEVFSESVAASQSMPMTPAYSELQEALAVATSAVMSQQLEPPEALANAQQAMEEAMAAQG